MRRVLKWLGIALGALVGLLVLAVIGVLIYGQITFKRSYSDRPLYPITADASPEGIMRGHHLVRITSCGECHAPATGTGELTSKAPSLARLKRLAKVPFRGFLRHPT